MKIYRYLIALIFFGLAVVSALLMYRAHFNPEFGNGFIAGDWLINFEDGGFKRRGLSGSLVFFIQDISGLKLPWVLYLMQLTLFLSFLICVLMLVWKKEMNLLYVTLFLSPLSFLAYFNDSAYLGRKEVMLFLLYAIFVYLLDRRKLTKFKEVGILAGIALITFYHELIIFFVPYFILALYISNHKFEIKRYALYFLAALVPFAVIMLFGGEINQGRSLDIIAERGVKLSSPNAIGILDDVNFSDGWRENLSDQYLYYLSFVLGFIHLVLYLRGRVIPDKFKIYMGLLLAFLYSSPLFYLAIDWGRWLQINFVLIILVLALLLRTWTGSPAKSLSFRQVLLKEYKVALLIPLLFLWGVHHCYHGFVPGGAVLTLYKYFIR